MVHVQHHRYPDYTMTESGLQYQDLRPGSGEQAQSGSRCEVDWDGYATDPPSAIITSQLQWQGEWVAAIR